MGSQETARASGEIETVCLRLAERLQGEFDPTLILSVAAETVGRHLDVNRCGYGEVDLEADTIAIPIDWVQGVASAIGRHPLRRGSMFVRAYEAGELTVIDDAEALDLPSDVSASLAAMACRAFVAAPLIHEGVLVGLFAVQSRAPRHWRSEEVALVERVAAMTWSAMRHAQTAARLRESEEGFHALADNIPAICWLANVDGKAFWMNALGRQYFGDTGGAEGNGAAVVHPDDYERVMALWAEALVSGREIETTVRTRGAEGAYRPFLSRAAPIRDASGAVVRWCGVQVDLTERQAHDRRLALFRALADHSRERGDSSAVLNAAARALRDEFAIDAFAFAERRAGDEKRFTVQHVAAFDEASADPSPNLTVALPVALERGEPLVVNAWSDDTHADTVGMLRPLVENDAAGGGVIVPIRNDEQVVALVGAFTSEPRIWTREDVELLTELADRVWSAICAARAETSLRARERTQAFLIEWSDALRRTDDPDAIMTMTMERLGRHLGASRVTYSEMEAEERVFTTKWNWVDGARSLVGLRVDLAALGPSVAREWLTGQIVRYDDVDCDPRASAADRAIYADRDIKAFVSIPLVRVSSVHAILSVQSTRPREWGDAEVGLIREVGERTWAVLERARAQAELRERDRTQRFVIDWSDRVRAEHAPATILDITMTMLATHLATSRVAYSQIDMAGGAYTIVSEACAGVPPTRGLSYPSSNLSDQVRDAYLAGETLVSPHLPSDERFSPVARARFAENRVVARIGVPLSRDGVVQAILSIDADVPREWTVSEVQLARDVAERMWVLLHRAEAEALLQERERNQAFLIAWSDRIRGEASPRAILAITLSMIGEHLGIARANYAESSDDRTSLEVLQEWRDGAVSVVGQRFPLAALGERVMASHLRGPAVVVRSVTDDPRFDDGNRPMYEAIGVAAFVSVSMVRDNAIEAVLSIQTEESRDWTAAEVQLIRDVADRSWSVLERARSEERLADSEALLTAFMENAPLGMHLKDANGRYLRMNPELARQIAIPVEEVVGRLPADFLPSGAARRVIELEQRALAGEVASAEFHFPDRTDYTALLAVVFPIVGLRGIARTGGFTLDLTARKAAEAALQRSRDALYQSEKLTALGSLLAGVSHELNNPLSIVVAQAVMLERQAKDGQLAERAFKIRKAADRCARIVQTFLAMARQKRPERAAVDLNAIVDAALDLAGYGLRSDGIAITFHRAERLPVIAADADQLHQIIINLLVNAQHAMAGRAAERRLTLTTAAGSEADTVVLEVADSGPGVPADVARRIFEPFFTTKYQGEGTGLGLSFSQGLAEAHGGRLELVPQRIGARFRLTLPVEAEQVLPPIGRAELLPEDASRSRRALLIDDEEEIAESLADFLELEGFACDVVALGALACERIDAVDYDLIVSDLRMPGMDGPMLYAWLAAHHPNLVDRIGFVTGDTLGASVAQFLADCGRPVLEKPFLPESVRTFLSELR